MHARLFSGIVAQGERRGTTLGFPTVNIPLQDTDVSGIFAGVVKHKDREYHAALFADHERGVLEAYLLDFDEDLYGQDIQITLAKKIRDAEVCTDDDVLKAMIAKDVEDVREYFLSI